MPPMKFGIHVRPLEAEDYGPIRNIERAIDSEYLRLLARSGQKDTVTPLVTRSYFKYYLKTGASFVAEVGEKPVGYILSQPVSFIYGQRKSLWLEFIAVLPDHRRRKIGSRLMKEVIGWARKHDCDSLYTTLNPNNKESAGLLSKNGFEIKKWMIAEKG